MAKTYEINFFQLLAIVRRQAVLFIVLGMGITLLIGAYLFTRPVTYSMDQYIYTTVLTTKQCDAYVKLLNDEVKASNHALLSEYLSIPLDAVDGFKSISTQEIKGTNPEMIMLHAVSLDSADLYHTIDLVREHLLSVDMIYTKDSLIQANNKESLARVTDVLNGVTNDETSPLPISSSDYADLLNSKSYWINQIELHALVEQASTPTIKREANSLVKTAAIAVPIGFILAMLILWMIAFIQFTLKEVYAIE